MPRHDAERLLAVIEGLLADPFNGDIQKMGGEKNVWRKGVGAYRIRYELIKEEKIVHISRAERRTSKTY